VNLRKKPKGLARKIFHGENFFQKIPKFCRDVRASEKGARNKFWPNPINPRCAKIGKVTENPKIP